MVFRVLKFIAGALILWGIIRGFVHYNDAEGGTGIARIVNAIVGGISDATYKLIPVVIDLVGGLFSGAAK